jgi:hypothetical protein
VTPYCLIAWPELNKDFKVLGRLGNGSQATVDHYMRRVNEVHPNNQTVAPTKTLPTPALLILASEDVSQYAAVGMAANSTL